GASRTAFPEAFPENPCPSPWGRVAVWGRVVSGGATSRPTELTGERGGWPGRQPGHATDAGRWRVSGSELRTATPKLWPNKINPIGYGCRVAFCISSPRFEPPTVGAGQNHLFLAHPPPPSAAPENPHSSTTP